MLFEVFWHTLLEQRRTLLAYGLGLLVYGLLAALVYPRLAMHSLPGMMGWFEQLVGIERPLRSAELWLNLAGFALVFPLVICSLAIWSGSRLIVADEQSGDLDLLLSYPLSRRRLALEKFAALAAGIMLITATLWLMLALANAAAHLKIPAQHLASACLGLGLLGLAFGALAFCIASHTARAAYARWIAWIVMGLTYLLSATWLHGISFFSLLSPFYYADALYPYGAGLPWLHIILLLAITAVCLDMARRGFERRDLAV
ncbi:MAG: ABC transporter permease subunit [Anaerolineaceae bacterium]|jgi:ABC-2 type transport system permease protein